MSIKFCPLCKSIMKDGICTNRKCGNSQLEIDFNNFVKKFSDLSNVKLREINGSYLHGLNLFQDSLTYDFSSVPKSNSLENLKILIEAGFNVDVKVTNFLVDEKKEINLDNYLVQRLIYYPLKKAKPMPQKIFKHYIELSLCVSKALNGNSKNISRAIVFGSNDFIKWESAGLNLSYDLGFNKDCYERLLAICNFSMAKAILWTVSIVDNKTGISIKTFFEKEKAYQLFKDREIKEGKKRRTALKHIVSKYERKSPQKIFVDEHFRGDMTFEWRGLTFKLTPPFIDKERIEKVRKNNE